MPRTLVIGVIVVAALSAIGLFILSEDPPATGTGSLEYHWQEGSVPPPGHYEYDVLLTSAGKGEVTFISGYPSSNPPVWRENFTFDIETWPLLMAQMQDNKLLRSNWPEAPFDEPIGGSLSSLIVTLGEQIFEIPTQAARRDDVNDLYAEIRETIPPELWQGLMARYNRYASTGRDREPSVEVMSIPDLTPEQN